MSTFFDRLFEKTGEETIVWSVHTTMTCDTAYTAALLEKQLNCWGELNRKVNDGMALSEKMGVFYHWDRSLKRAKPTTMSVCSKTIPQTAVEALQFKVSAPTTLHAKISLVCFRNDTGESRFRLAVYTKNMGFNDLCAEAALLFDLQKESAETDSGKRLCGFFDTIYQNISAESPDGKKWLEDHGLCPGGDAYEHIKTCSFHGKLLGDSDIKRPAELFFGGCGEPQTLGERLELPAASGDSIVLTPPFFLYQKRGETSAPAEDAGADLSADEDETPEANAAAENAAVPADEKSPYLFSKAWKYFEACKESGKGPQLYDLNKDKATPLLNRSSSHIKLYLLEKPNDGKPLYEFWLGSANATTRGIGWNFASDPAKQGKAGAESIECLVKFQLNKDAFYGLRKALCDAYQPFSFNPKDSTLKVNPDRFGPYFCVNYQPTKIIYLNKKGEIITSAYRTNARALEVSFKCLKRAAPEKAFPEEQLVWCPSEYGFTQTLDETQKIAVETQQSVTLRFPFNKFKDAQGMLCFGKSKCTMSIADLLAKSDVPTQTTGDADQTLTQWLKDPAELEADEIAHKPEGLQWMYQVLQGKMPADRVNALAKTVLEQDSSVPGAGLLISQEDSAQYMKPQQLPFQKNATHRLHEILKIHSRAFLADEAGLGKTYSSAGVVYRLAKEQWKRQGANPTPFYALYVAPNRDLLKKNGDDIVRKTRKDFIKTAGETEVEIKTIYEFTDTKYLQMIYERRYLEACKIWFKQMCEHAGENQEKREKYQAWLDALLQKRYWLRTRAEREAVIEQNLWKVFGGPIVKEAREWRALAYTWLKPLPYPDRVAFLEPYLQATENAGKCIVLIPLSINLISGGNEESEPEKAALCRMNLCRAETEAAIESRADCEKVFLKTYKPGIVLWDEYHRYHTKVAPSQSDNKLLWWERESHLKTPDTAMKSLFISATPYQTNISGKESNALEGLYSFDEKEKMETLPSFMQFAALYCDGYYQNATGNWTSLTASAAENLKSRHDVYLQKLEQHNAAKQTETQDALKDAQTLFQNTLRARMVRHERTRLQKEQEQHVLLYPANSLYQQKYADILRNMFHQSKTMKELGYPDGAVSWSWSLPWILGFSAENRRAKNTKNESNYFQVLTPQASLANAEHQQAAETLFAYDDSGAPKPILKSLPNQSLALGQICRENLRETMTQLLWVPPTAPLYKPSGIYETWSGYSKLLVFAEYQYLQRGGATLLSDYAMLKNLGSSVVPKSFPPALNLAHAIWLKDSSFSLTQEDFREKSLDELIAWLKEQNYAENTLQALALIASPAACARGLDMDAEAAETAFNRYFARDGVREALWTWMCQREYAAPTRWEEGILRYCAEGNLYAVLEEYQFADKDGDLCRNLQKVLDTESGNNAYQPSKVYVQTLKTSINREDGKERRCSFADRLTSDTNDDGSGAKDAKVKKADGTEETEEVRTAVAGAFSSPFWPMVMFAGRGAQEGMDFHQYCLRIMHQTLPRGAVSLEQRQGRIDRYRSLLVRRRAAEKLYGLQCKTTERLLERMFAQLVRDKVHDGFGENQIYPHWSIPNGTTKWNFQRMMPFWEYTKECYAANILMNMLASYRVSFGVRPDAEFTESIDLSAPPAPNEETSGNK